MRYGDLVTVYPYGQHASDLDWGISILICWGGNQRARPVWGLGPSTS